MAWMRDVFSTMVSQIGWDEELDGMIVVWRNGKKTLYMGVNEGLAEEVATTASVGLMLNTEIKGSYSYRNM